MADKEKLYWIGRGTIQIGGKSYKKNSLLPDPPKDKKLLEKWEKDVENWKKAGLVSSSAVPMTTSGNDDDSVLKKQVKEVSAKLKESEASVSKLEEEKAALEETVKKLTSENEELRKVAGGA